MYSGRWAARTPTCAPRWSRTATGAGSRPPASSGRRVSSGWRVQSSSTRQPCSREVADRLYGAGPRGSTCTCTCTCTSHVHVMYVYVVHVCACHVMCCSHGPNSIQNFDEVTLRACLRGVRPGLREEGYISPISINGNQTGETPRHTLSHTSTARAPSVVLATASLVCSHLGRLLGAIFSQTGPILNSPPTHPPSKPGSACVRSYGGKNISYIS